MYNKEKITLNFLEKNKENIHDFPSNLQDLTIVIPSYSRQNFLLRQIRYWNGSGAKLIIIDGSDNPLDNDFILALKYFKDTIYINCQSSLTERLAIASRLIKTNYSVYCSDDDFLLPSGLSRAIKILETNNNIVACMGQTFRFDVLNESKLTFGPCYSFNYQLFSINDYDSRLKFAVSKYSPVTCHAVMRTQIWQESWGNIPNFSSSQVLEFFQAFMTHIYGNLLVIKDLYLIRSLENLPLSTPDASRSVTSKIWMDSNKYDQEVNYFIKIISNKIKYLYPQAYNRTEVELLVRNLLHFLIANLSSHRNKKGVFDKFITLFRLKFINTYMRKLVRLFFSNKRKLHYGFVNDLTPGDYGDVTLDQESVIYLKRVELLIFNFYRSLGK